MQQTIWINPFLYRKENKIMRMLTEEVIDR